MGNIGTIRCSYDVLPLGQPTAAELFLVNPPVAVPARATDPSPGVPAPEPMPAPYPQPVPEPAPVPPPQPGPATHARTRV